MLGCFCGELGEGLGHWKIGAHSTTLAKME